MDCVSSLPDELLCQILSLLPTKQAAVTHVLSKRWLNLWKLVPNLDIDDSVFLHPEEGKAERDEIRQSFVDFVDRVMAMQGDAPVTKFSLQCITGIHPDCVNRWICNVLQRGVRDLELFTDFADEDVEYGYQLPREMFISSTLVRLKLRSEHCVDWWCRGYIGGTFLPMLKSLYIDSDLIFCGEIETFLPYFPALEELRMANMEWGELDITVSSPSLTKLNLHGTGCEEGLVEFHNPKSVSFDTPSLLFLSYTDFVAEDYPLVNMEKLVDASFNLTLMEEQIKRIRASNNDGLEDGEDDEVLRFGNVVKLMNGVRNVQKLSLVSDTLEVLSLCCESMPVFNNLKFLGITNQADRGWQAMPVILRNCPHLETIIFKGLLHHVTDKCGDACPCVSRVDKGHSLRFCLVKLLEIQGFRGTMKEMKIIKHFLDYFPCLKLMKVYIEENDPTQLKNPEISDLVIEMFELYDELSSCNVQLLVSDYLDHKWTAQGSM